MMCLKVCRPRAGLGKKTHEAGEGADAQIGARHSQTDAGRKRHTSLPAADWHRHRAAHQRTDAGCCQEGGNHALGEGPWESFPASHLLGGACASKTGDGKLPPPRKLNPMAKRTTTMKMLNPVS